MEGDASFVGKHVTGQQNRGNIRLMCIHTYIHKYGLNIQYVPNTNLNAVEASGRPTWLSPYGSHLFKIFEAKTVDYLYPYGSEPQINRRQANPLIC